MSNYGRGHKILGNINCVRLFLIWASRSRVDVKKDFSLFLALVIIYVQNRFGNFGRSIYKFRCRLKVLLANSISELYPFGQCC